MNKKTIAIALAAVITAFGAVQYFTMLSSEVALFERFPDIDPKIVVKAHRTIIRGIWTGKYNSTDMSDDAACDRLFLEVVETLTK